MNDELKLGIIGCNYWGRNLLRNFVENNGCRIVACSDLRSSNQEIIKERYPGINLILNPLDLVNNPEIEALVIASDLSTHCGLAKEAVTKGKHLLFDKLLASNSQEAKELVGLARANNSTLMVTTPVEYSPAGIKIQEFISSKKLGKIYYIASSRINLGIHREDINVIWDLARHDVSLHIWWLGETPIKVWASGKAIAHKKICDTAFISMEFPSGTITDIEVSWLAPTKLRMTLISGSKKMLTFDDTESVEKIRIYDKGADLKNPEDFGEFQLSYRSGDVLSPKLDTYEPLNKVVEHFLESVKNKTTPRTNGTNGIEVIRVLEAIDRALGNGGAVERVGG